MNKPIKSKIKSLLCATLAFSVLSCNIQPSFNETSGRADEESLISNPQVSAPALNIISFVQLNMNVGTGATGTVTVELRNDNDALVFSTTRDVASMVGKGRPTWYTFVFPNTHTVSRGAKLKLYIIRSTAHQPATSNTIFLSTSSSDSYTRGTSSLGNKDISFVTFNSFYYPIKTDQRQGQVQLTQALDNTYYVWQQFETGESTGTPVGLLTDVELNVKPGLTNAGAVELSILNGNGTEVLENSAIPTANLPLNKWASFHLPSPIVVTLGQKHRMQVTLRTVVGDPAPPDYIIWAGAAENCSSTDYYRHGVSSRGCDFTFRTFGWIGSGLDQVQEVSAYPFRVTMNAPQWQEFVPGAAL